MRDKSVSNTQNTGVHCVDIFHSLCAFILLTSTILPGINSFIVIIRPLHQLQIRKRCSRSCYMIETYVTRHRFPVIEP